MPTPLLNLNKFSVQQHSQHHFTLGTPSYTQSESSFFVCFPSWFLNNQKSGQQLLGHNQNQNNKINRQPPHWSWDVKQCKLIINSTKKMKIKLFLKTQLIWQTRRLDSTSTGKCESDTCQKKNQPKSQGVHAKQVTKKQTGEKKSVR